MKSGDKVVWKSQSQGSWIEKHGIVIADIPAGKCAKKHIPSSAKKSHIKFDMDCSCYDRVLIEVSAGKDGQIMHYYCPRKNVVNVKED